ncbi:MAG: nuclear transport factor 2 family protein [Microscillaceae bacterium]|jgi:hypothetical protein|nr:nuclear transport factor 2 family protein [Microscillaceae bacterium]
MKRLFLSLLLALPMMAYSQTTAENEVIAVIKQMFDGMRKGDSSMVRAVFDASIRLQTTFTNKDGKSGLHTENTLDNFLKAVGTPHPQVFDERIKSYEVRIDDNLATVWTPYEFYLGTTFSHCGVNAFQLFKSEKGWKIIHITDTRRKQGCQ